MSLLSSLQSRLIAGAVGGIVGTVAMTAAMRRLHRLLPVEERYPLPPREITERVVPAHGESATRDLTSLAHLGFGAAASALATTARPLGPVSGSGWGLIVWLASYFGWVPFNRILRPAGRHPARRNALMIFVHLIWGTVSALAAKEMLKARQSILADGPLLDAPPGNRRP